MTTSRLHIKHVVYAAIEATVIIIASLVYLSVILPLEGESSWLWRQVSCGIV